MSKICSKIVEEAISVQMSQLGILKEKRGRRLTIDDVRPYVDEVNKIGAIEGQSSSVIGLYIDSVNAHFKALSNLASIVQPEEEACLKRQQVPAVLEILYQEDSGFRKSVDIFIDGLEESKNLVGQDVMKGLERSINSASRVGPGRQATPSAIIGQVLRSLPIPEEHSSAILAASPWILGDSCGIGRVFFREVEAGTSLEQALDAEIIQIKSIFNHPAEAQVEVSKLRNNLAFDAGKYIAKYRREVEDSVKEAVNDGVHYANVLNISALSVEGMSPLSQSSIHMAGDDLAMAVLEAVTKVIESSLIGSANRFKSPDHPLILATGAVGCALEYILEMDRFSVLDIVGLLRKGSTLSQSQFSNSAGTSDFYYLDFVDMVYNGWRYLDNTQRKGKACTGRGLPLPKVTWFDVDLSPILDNEVLMNPQRYSNPASPISARLSVLLRLSDRPELFNAAAISVIMANILSAQKEKAICPADIYRNYVMGRLSNSNIDYCHPAEAA